MLEDFYRDPSTKLGSNIHEINYFVVTDLETLEKYYCTSAYFYVIRHYKKEMGEKDKEKMIF